MPRNSFYVVTVYELSKRLPCGFLGVHRVALPSLRPALSAVACALAFVVTTACHQNYEYRDAKPGSRGIVTTPVRDYPFGDAADVYRAALDLLYGDETDRPSVIVLRDSAILRYGSQTSCTKCPWFSPHRSRIDTSTIAAFTAIPPVKPRLRKFDYTIPISFLSNTTLGEIWRTGQTYDSANPRRNYEALTGIDREFLRRFPGAWGTTDFSLVGFNRAHTEALLEVRHFCGGSAACHSLEVVFFKKVKGKWQPIERMPWEVQVWNRTRLRYRGPGVERTGQSELLVDQLGNPLRPNSKDEPGIYRAVLDSLYSFHGERPRMVVISDQHAANPSGLLPYKHRIDSSTRAAFAFQVSISDPMNAAFSYRLPTAVLTYDSIRALEQEGIPLQRKAVLAFAGDETTGFWLAFRERYPNSWGYVELSRIGYNPQHTEALVYSVHKCGDGCENGDTWLLLRDGEKWTVAEKMPQHEYANWALDSLRYLGRSADPLWYRTRRAHGVITNAETGAVLPFLDVTFRGGAFRGTVKTDSAGRYTVEGLPLSGELFFKVRCPIAGRADSVAGPYVMTRPGLDTTVNVEVPFRMCVHLNRSHPLIARGTKTTPVDARALSPEVPAVYGGVLDALFPPTIPDSARIMLEAWVSRRCDYCIEPEIPRLVRKGLIDPSTEINFTKAPTDEGLTPVLSYRRKVEFVPIEDQYWIRQGGYDWNAMKDAYPGVDAVYSFSGVGFSDRGNEALVQVHTESPAPSDGEETMLLRKNGAAWHVTLRHVEREATSGEWSAGKCEPADAPARVPTRAEIVKLSGEFGITRVGASRQFRGQTDTIRVRLEPLKPSPRANELASKATVVDTKGQPEREIAATFELTQGTATITFSDRLPEGMVQLDGWLEEHKILRTDSRGFFGTWYTVNGPTIPLRGYFCALRM